MGMDYYPRSRKAQGFHLNWTGHEFMGRVLDQLGADLDEWAGTNDGYYIRAATCRAWAGLLQWALDAAAVRVALVPSELYESGIKDVPVVADAEVKPGSLTWLLDRLDQHFGVSQPLLPTTPVVALDADWTEAIKDFAAFLETCGGCYQY